MTPRQRKLARQALGLPNASRESIRNRLFAGKGSIDRPNWTAMVEAGFAVHFPSGDDQEFDFYRLSRAGADRALDEGERLRPEDFPSISAH